MKPPRATLLAGKTTSTAAIEDEVLSIEVLVADFADLIQTIFPEPASAPTFLVVYLISLTSKNLTHFH